MTPVTIKLAYGKTGLLVDLPEENLTVVEPQFVPGLADEVLPMGCTSFRAEAWVCTEYLKADFKALTGILEGATVEII